MKRIMKFIKQNMIGFILGILLTGIGVVTAATLVPATGVSYSNSTSNVTNVSGALDELFAKLESSGNSVEPLNIGINSNNFALHSQTTSGAYAAITTSYAQVGCHNNTSSNTAYFASLEYYDLSKYNSMLTISPSVSGWNSIEPSIAFGGWNFCLFDKDNNVIPITNSNHLYALFADLSSYTGQYKIGFSVTSGGGTVGFGIRYSRISGSIRLS